MLNYKEWELLNECLSGMNSGVKSPTNLGLMGKFMNKSEAKGLDLTDELEDEDLDDEDLDDEDLGDEDLEPTDKDFPPEDSDDMGLDDIDPELAGLGDEDDMGLDDIDPELAGLGGEDELGDMDVDDLEMDDDLGDDLGDDELGDMDVDDLEMDDDLGDDELGDMDVDDLEMEDDDDLGDDVEMDDDLEGEELAMSDLMHRMKDYMKRYMAPKMKSHMSSERDMKGGVPSFMKKCYSSKFMKEDALFQATNPNDTIQGENPGQVGFAPQGRIGSIGGGYTKDDFADLPVLGED